MGGYEGHRGWINYLAVSPDLQKSGYGRQLMKAVEKKIAEQGAPKINLQIRTSNVDVIAFYKAIGYKRDDVVGMGKRLIDDE
jgi:ribosomal protein S18 acetylase RimI-like enzyme